MQENDVKFIRLAFSDMFGIQKNISVMPDELPRAFETGISFDASGGPGISQRGTVRFVHHPGSLNAVHFTLGGPPTAGWCGCSAM